MSESADPGPGFVVTGGGRGVGRAVVERLLRQEGTVAIIERDAAAMEWTAEHPDAGRLLPVVGDAGEEAVAERAAEQLADVAALSGWVNNAAVFRDGSLHADPPAAIIALIDANLAPVVAGCAAAVRRFLAQGSPGAIVNVSSHQAQRAVSGAAAYSTAKAAIEGLTRALAVDYGPSGIRVNAVALGSIDTERYALHRNALQVDKSRALDDRMADLHPLGRIGQPQEVASVVTFLLSEQAAFVSCAVVPVDGGRAAAGQDPQARRVV